MSNARDKANIPTLNFASTGIDDNATSTAITIDSFERVGIGTTSPSSILHVQQSAVSSAPSRTSALYLENNGNCEIQFVGNSSNDCQLRFGTSSDSFSGVVEYELDNDNMKFYTNSGERMRIDSSGHVIAPYGVTLGTSAGTYNASNTLDDYEEGLHTVTATDTGGGATITMNTSYDQLAYTKIGRVVHVQGILL